MADSQTNHVIDEIKRDMENIYEPLVSNSHHSKLPENIFKDYFLPFFAGKAVNNNAMAEWVSIAGSPLAEVDIIDPAGNTLFSVPSVFDTSVISLNNFNRNRTMSEIMNKFELEGNNIPQLANTNLANGLSSKLNTLYEKENERNNKQSKWNSILERYGYIDKASDKKVNNANIDDDLIYD